MAEAQERRADPALRQEDPALKTPVNSRVLLQAVLLLVTGCAVASRPFAVEQRREGAPAVQQMLSDRLASLERADSEVPWLAPEAFSWGVGVGDVFVGRDAVARSARQEPFTAKEVDRRVFLSADGRSAWFREIYTRSGRQVRHTGLAGETGGKWLILAQHTSFAYGSDVDEKDQQGMLPELAPVGDGIEAGAEEVSALFRTVVFFDRMVAAATPGDFVLIGTEPGYIAGSIVRPLPAANQDGPRPKDGVRAGLGPGGLTAWAAANMVWIEKGKRTMGPMRFLFVFVREGARWRVVQNHHSFAPE